jgi:hypothetical protein
MQVYNQFCAFKQSTFQSFFHQKQVAALPVFKVSEPYTHAIMVKKANG